MRVLLEIDVSGSVNEPLFAGDPRTRIQAAQEWAPRALDALDERDQLGIAAFSTARPEPWIVVPIRSLTKTQKDAITAGLASLQADNWGTPLHQSIAWGVEQLQRNWVYNAKQTLVVLTDGAEHASNDPHEQRLATANAKSRLRATDQVGKNVAILTTATPPAANCSDYPRRFYDKCYRVLTETDLRATLNGILRKLGLTVPNEDATGGSQ